MSAAEFRPGALVDITIRGVLVVEVTASRLLRFDMAAPKDLPGSPDAIRISLYLDSHGVTVERVAPADWPPRIGDLWRDKHDEAWFVHGMPDGTPGEIMRTAKGSRWYHAPAIPGGYDGQLDDNAPWTLVHREERAS